MLHQWLVKPAKTMLAAHQYEQY